MNTTNTSNCGIDFKPGSNQLMTIYIIVFVVGLIVNLITLGPIIQQVRGHNVLGVYLLNLSISDLLYTLTMPLWIHYYHNNHVWTLGRPACLIAGFLFYSNMYVSIGLLCCISVDRCLAVKYPLHAKVFRKCRYACVLSAVVVLVVMGTHAVAAWLNYDLKAQVGCYENYPLTIHVARVNLIRVAFGFLVPLLLLTFCYFKIFQGVQRSIGVEDRWKRKVKLLSIAVIVIFSFCFAPYHIILLLRTAVFYQDQANSCPFENQVYHYFTVSLAMSILNSVVDPILYVLLSNGVKEDMKNMARFPFRRKRQLGSRTFSILSTMLSQNPGSTIR
ncbi:G-protein coupled receptor 4 [Acipenser ruthenus]|uniref:G-protein coupled receptor 4 n=1 Tax=Acipenser ruthenus TaxID=7906 RepID=A0A444UJF6_ACIRT|nr:G-protein coupled receptor 4-like [Acipenser ruthenus]RXM35326.1 G-protein coupled receptor 4 [Acipenser ruthenus]